MTERPAFVPILDEDGDPIFISDSSSFVLIDPEVHAQLDRIEAMLKRLLGEGEP